MDEFFPTSDQYPWLDRFGALSPCVCVGILEKAEGDSVLNQGMNIFAGILLVIYTYTLGAYATTALNVVWAAIGIFTLGRKWLTRN